MRWVCGLGQSWPTLRARLIKKRFVRKRTVQLDVMPIHFQGGWHRVVKHKLAPVQRRVIPSPLPGIILVISLRTFSAYVAMTFAWSWACWMLLALVEPKSTLMSGALFLIGGFGPGIAAVAMVVHDGGRVGLRRWLTRCLQWRTGWHWMLLAFVFPIICMGLAAAIHLGLGGTLPASPAAGHVLLTAVNFVLIMFVGGPVGEEFGWRGYALPVLQDRVGWRTASFILGVVWAVWHLPLFYIPGTVQNHLAMGLYAVSAIASSILFGWLFNRTAGSVLPVLVLHTAVNAWSGVIPVMVMPDGTNLRPFQLVVGILAVVASALLFSSDPPVPAQASTKPDGPHLAQD